MHPVVIISGNVLNDDMPIVITCTLNTKIKGYKGNLILQPNETKGLAAKSEVLTFQNRSLSKERLVKKIEVFIVVQPDKLKVKLGDVLSY